MNPTVWQNSLHFHFPLGLSLIVSSVSDNFHIWKWCQWWLKTDLKVGWIVPLVIMGIHFKLKSSTCLPCSPIFRYSHWGLGFRAPSLRFWTGLGAAVWLREPNLKASRPTVHRCCRPLVALLRQVGFGKNLPT